MGVAILRTALFAAAGVLAVAAPARAQLMLLQSGLLLASYDDGTAGPQWLVTKSEHYSPVVATSRLSQLGVEAQVYANNNPQRRFPDQASALFAEEYVDDPLTFYSPGDANDPPTTIDNDVPDAANSALISFDYPAAGLMQGDPEQILFIDNTPANHAGLGRSVVYADGHHGFIPASPHVFSDIHLTLADASGSFVLRGDDPAEPFALDLPADVAAEGVGAPHRYDLLAQLRANQDVLDTFDSEGYHEVNLYSASAFGSIALADATLAGPTATPAVTLYVQFDVLFSRNSVIADEQSIMRSDLRWTGEGAPSASAPGFILQTTLDFTEPVTVANGVVVTDYRPLAPAAGASGGEHAQVRVCGIAQHTVQVPPGELGNLQYMVFGSVQRFLSPSSADLDHIAAVNGAIDLPATPGVDQVVMFAPAGYTLQVPNALGPSDLVRLGLRGDRDLDGDVDDADAAAFADAYTRPLASMLHAPTSFAGLAWFDFDGDADVDCADHYACAAAWTQAGGPPVFAPCATDSDADGVPDGDDDCGGTPLTAMVGGRGCPMGDFDADGDVDLDDYAAFNDCGLHGALPPLPAPPTIVADCLNAFDSDDSGAVDLRDFGVLQTRFGFSP